MAFSTVLQMYLDWANSLLCEHGIVINELKEFQDGRIFSLLIQILTKTQLFPSSEDCNDDDETSSLDRVQTILDYLLGLGVKLKVTASGVLKGELKSILDVIWAIILHFTVHSPDAPMQQKTVRNGKKQLIQWCASQLGENTFDAGKGLAQCFEKNNKLAELIGLFSTYSKNSTETYVNNLTTALIAAEENFGIAKSLLSPADVVRGTVEEHALTIYLALLRRKVTQLAIDNDQSEKSSDLNTSAVLPEGLTEEVANSLSQTFSFKFMRSPNVSASTPHSAIPANPNLSSQSHDPASNGDGDSTPPAVRKKNAPPPSKIPVSSSAKPNQQRPAARAEGDPASIAESSSRKRHQVSPDEQKPVAAATADKDKGFKMPSGIPVRKTQKLSSFKPAHTSTPNAKQKQQHHAGVEAHSAAIVHPSTLAEGAHPVDGFGETEVMPSGDEGMVGVGETARKESVAAVAGNDVVTELQGVCDDEDDPAEGGGNRAELDVSGIEEDERSTKEDKVKNEVDDASKGVKGVGVMQEGGSASNQDVSLGRVSEEQKGVGTERRRRRRRAAGANSSEDASQENNQDAIARAGSSGGDGKGNLDYVGGAASGWREGLDRDGDECDGQNLGSRMDALVREEGDGQRAAGEQTASCGDDREEEDGRDERKRRASLSRSTEESSLDRSLGEEVGLLRRGEELSFVLPKGLDLSGGRGDELLAMLEAIGTEGKQLRQELNEAKERENFLTMKLNERFSSQEEEVINRLVGELEMLRRENQRMFQELATARESGAEDRKRCEKLQVAVERLDMDVERLTAENFRLKFAADTGYQVTGDDLLAAMADADAGFQLLPSPGKENLLAAAGSAAQETIPSPILEAQSHHETKLLAMKAETSSMRKLQELLTSAHTENRRLKAQQQHWESSPESQEEIAKVMAELEVAKEEGERLQDENKGLQKEIEGSRLEIERQMLKNRELERVIIRTARDERESLPRDSFDASERTARIDATKSESGLVNSERCTGIASLSTESESGMTMGDSKTVNPANSRSMARLSEVSVSEATEMNSRQINARTSTGVVRRSEAGGTLPSQETHSHMKTSHPVDLMDDKATYTVNTKATHEHSGRKDLLVKSGGGSVQSHGKLKLKSDDDREKSATDHEVINTDVDQRKITLPLKHTSARNVGILSSNSEDEKPGIQSLPNEPAEAVVDWKYLAMSPSPENEMRSIAQYVSRPTDLETASEVESETESRASDLFGSSTVSSPVGRILSAHERRPSLGGMIVAQAQKFPVGADNHSPVFEQDLSPARDDTLIDESYLTTSRDYVTADERSLRNSSSKGHDSDVAEDVMTSASKTTHRAEGLTPYYTPMVQRNRMQFSSLTSSLESLKSISRKAREDIEAEMPIVESATRKVEFTNEIEVPTLEQERKWIQEELARIRLDNNIPGEKYRDLGIGKDNSSFSSEVSPPDGGSWRFMSGRYVPRWRKFQYRTRRTRTSEATRPSITSSEALGLTSRHHTGSVNFTRMHLTGGEGDVCEKTSPKYGLKIVSPSRSCSDLSDEYKPLPDELRKPQILAENSPGKHNRHGQRSLRSQPPNTVLRTSLSPGSSSSTKQKFGSASVMGRDKYDAVINESSTDRDMKLPPAVTSVLPENGDSTNADVRPSSPTGSDDISASDSVSMISAPPSRKPYSSPQQAIPTPSLPLDVVEAPNSSDRTSLFMAQSGSEVVSVNNRIGDSGGIHATLTSADMDALVEKVILEADSGVSLTSNLDIKNGIPPNNYQHRLLTQDEQTYANSLIAKYIVNIQDKY